MENKKETIKLDPKKGLLIDHGGLIMFGKLDEIDFWDSFKDRKNHNNVPSGVKLRFISHGKIKKVIGGQERMVNKTYFTHLSLHGKTATETNENTKIFKNLIEKELYIPLKNDKDEASFSFDADNVVVLTDDMKKDGGFHVKEHGCYLTGKLDNIDTESYFDKNAQEFRDRLVLKFFTKIKIDKKIGSENHSLYNTKTENFYLNTESDEDLVEKFDKFQAYENKELLLTVLNDKDKVTYNFDKSDIHLIDKK